MPHRLIIASLLLGLAACATVGTPNGVTGAIEITQQRYLGGAGAPYFGAQIGGRRLGNADPQIAQEELRFQAAGMALEAGYRHMRVFDETTSDLRGAPSPTRGDPADLLARRLGTSIGNAMTASSRKDRGFFVDVRFLDAPDAQSIDALEVYNRLGAKLDPDFVPSAGPTAAKQGFPAEQRPDW